MPNTDSPPTPSSPLKRQAAHEEELTMNEYDELMPFLQHGILTGLPVKKKKRLMAL